jgi:hypothetical protein
MIKIMKNILAIALFALTFMSCRKESLNPVATGEPGVYGQGKILSGSFVGANDAASKVDFQLKWIDVNKKLTMSKQELLITYYRDYIDKNDNPATADFGTKSFKTMDCKGNNEASTFSITANDVYTLFASGTFDFGTGKVPVFGADRSAGKRFTQDDYFKLTWAFTGSNGLVYKWWSVSVVNGEVYADAANKSIIANADVYWDVK